MNAARWFAIYGALLWSISAIGSVAADSAQQLTVTQITRGGSSISSDSNVILLTLDGHSSHGIRVGQSLTGDFTLAVPAGESVVIGAAWNNVTLGSGAVDTFHFTGAVESVAVRAGRLIVDDPLHFYSVAGHDFDATGSGAIYSVVIGVASVTITCTKGHVVTRLYREIFDAGGLSKVSRSVARVDRLAPGGRASIIYSARSDNPVNISVLVDKTAAEADDTNAEFNLASRYLFGLGVPRNYPAASHWYRLAAARKFADAQDGLGTMYYSGYGVHQDDASALHWYGLASEKGNATAQNHVAVIYQDGSGVNQSDSAALRLYQAAALQGDAAGESALGDMSEQARIRAGLASGTDQPDEDALHWYRLAAVQEYAYAENVLGQKYFSGDGVRKDYASALGWLRLAASHGYADAADQLGRMYYLGEGVAPNYATALQWFKTASKSSSPDELDPPAAFYLGQMYELGRGVPKNYKTALKWYQMASHGGTEMEAIVQRLQRVIDESDLRSTAAHGSAAAQNRLGDTYYGGEGVKQNYVTALHWYRLAAARKNVDAEYRLGWMYKFGQGVPKDDTTAAHWFRVAAAAGYADAEHGLSEMYERGIGVPRDAALAQRWYSLFRAQTPTDGYVSLPQEKIRLAATHGVAAAQNNLGDMYALGFGVTKNYFSALYWYRLAAAQGYPRAKASVRHIQLLVH
jgi:TPR repeat protein